MTNNLIGPGNQGVQIGQHRGNINYYSGTGTMTAAPETTLDELSLPFALSLGIGVETFVGRGKELGDIHPAFKDGPGNRSILVLHGLGGIGKTQLATKYATDHCDEYLAVIWLNGNGADSLNQSFAEAARRLRDEHPTSTALKTIVELVNTAEMALAMVRWLGRGSNKEWLLVFDNVDNPKLPGDLEGAYYLTQYIPAADHVHILVTA
jgi:AAA ATPase domain